MRRVSDTFPDPARARGRPRARNRRWRLRGWGVGVLLSAACWAPAGAATAAAGDPAIRGLPFRRSYPFDEIENVNAGARLSFDPFGRVAVVCPGAYVVLNGTTWLDIESKDAGEVAVVQVVDDGNGHFYYGAYGSWGTVDFAEGDRLRPRSLVPAAYPKWAATNNYWRLVVAGGGVYFAGWDGVVYWDRASGQHQFFRVAGVAQIFAVGDRVFVYSHSQRLQYVDIGGQALRAVDCAALGTAFVDQATALDRTRVLVATSDSRLLSFDGESFAPWHCALGDRLNGRITCLKRLPEGSVAIAVTGQGLYLVAEDGRLVLSLTDPEHQQITDLAAREPGALWAATETGVEKILYRSPVEIFGQRLGLPLSWPQVVRWNHRVAIASAGRLYEATVEAPGAPAHFRPVAGQPARGVNAVAANGPRMLVGNVDGVFARNDDGSFAAVPSGIDASRLVMTSPDFCYVIGAAEIGALRWENGRWSACAATVPGAGFPSVAHAARDSAWIELGGNRIVRVSYREGSLHIRHFDGFASPDSGWANVGVVGDTVVLTSSRGERQFFDERTERLVEAPGLQALLDRAPFRINRVEEDAEGTLWATHDRGVLILRRAAAGYSIDATGIDVIGDRNLIMQRLPDGDIWFSTGSSLYHIDRSLVPAARPSFKPILVSVTHGGVAVAREAGGSRFAPLRFPYAENSLGFRFFAGGYASRRVPACEFRLVPAADRWTSLGTGSLLTLPNLREGRYRLDVRLADDLGRFGDVLSVDFEIDPPWFRTWWAYTLYGLAAAVAALGVLRWVVRRTHARNIALKRSVRERTVELELAMARLQEETRTTATLAERNRLAGEIHDSVQQGLSGLMLQLDSTLKLPGIADDVRSRLGVARNMVSFTREEVQRAVWDMESPLLETTELGDALRKTADLVSTGDGRIEIAITGAPVALPALTKHHLLRIAQEAITNAVRHGAARAIAVQLAYAPEGLTLSVADDGCGFTPNEALAAGVGRFGLRGLRERVIKIGGTVDFRSAPGAGASIRVAVPLPGSAPSECHAPPS